MKIIAFLFIFYYIYEIIRNVYTMLKPDDYKKSHCESLFARKPKIKDINKYLTYSIIQGVLGLLLWLFISFDIFHYNTLLALGYFVILIAFIVFMIMKINTQKNLKNDVLRG